MTQVSFNDVRNAVFAALAAAFPDIPVTGEEPREGTAFAGFSVRLQEPEHKHELGRRYLRKHPFVIRYRAADGSDADLYDVAEQMVSVLRQVEVAGRPVRGTDMRFEIANDEGEELRFFVNYNFHVWAPRPDDPAMAHLDVQEGLK